VKLLRVFFVSVCLAVLASACAPNLCQRKHTVMTSSACSGKSLAYSPDTLCERNLDVCNANQLAAFKAYVRCLEAMKMCSFEAVNQCAAAHRGGVNLQCAG
jgi:hypothetical protein